MSNETPTVQSSAVINTTDKPSWDFAQVTAYPMELKLKKDGDNPVVYAYMTPYTADELIEILRKAVTGYRREKRDVELVREDRSIYTPMYETNFVKLGNASGTPEQQREFINKIPHVKASIVELSFGGLRAGDGNDETDSEPSVQQDTFLDIAAPLDGAIKVWQDIYDPATDKVVRVKMAHNYKLPTETQFREYRSARRSKFVQRTTVWTISENHSALQRLYDAVIQSIDCGAVNGVPCNTDNKAQWLGSVPLWHKLFIVDQIFDELLVKNG